MIQFSNCLAAVVIDALSPPLPRPPPLASDKTFRNGKEEKEEEDDDEEEVRRTSLARSAAADDDLPLSFFSFSERPNRRTSLWS